MRKAVGVVALLVVLYALFVAERPQRAPAASVAVPGHVQTRAVVQFSGMPGISTAEWVDGDFVLGVVDNGSSWQPVTESACAWLRQQGAPAGVAVIAVEAQALRNQKWTQLARARCN